MTTLPGPLVAAGWLADHLGEEGLVVVDSRWTPDASGRSSFITEHVPGAVYLDIDDDLAAPPAYPGGRHPLPAPEVFAATMSRAGIGDEDSVVVYDVSHGSHAARLWWMLTVTGHRAAVLDGGLPAWDGPVVTGEPDPRTPAAFTACPWPAAAIVDATGVATALATGQGLVLDIRAPERYRGEVEPFDAKAGHIPGAMSAPWAENIDPATGRFRAPVVLAERYRDLGVDRSTILQCGSGITASHAALAIRLAGLPMPRLYVGSWSDWVSDPDRPIATGDEP